MNPLPKLGRLAIWPVLSAVAPTALVLASMASFARGESHPTAGVPSAPSVAPKTGSQEPPKDVSKDLADARAALVTRLLELATWCNTSELFEDRDKTYKQVLVLQPENVEAHKGLHHIHALNGTWKEEVKHDPKNRPNPKAMAELPQRRADALRPFGEKLAALAKETSDMAA